MEYHDAFRQSASYLMDREDDLEVVSQADSVAEGREKMAEGGIDAAIVDVPLPDEGAAEIVGDLHDANPSIPVLVMTLAEDPEVRERFLKAGATRGALQGEHLRGGPRRRQEARGRSVGPPCPYSPNRG